MKTTLKTRIVGLLASLTVTFSIVDLIAVYALPEQAPMQLAIAPKK